MEYDRLINHPEITFIFCVDKDLNCYNIPLQDILNSGITCHIKLRTTPNANHQRFETYKYKVSIN